MSITIEETYRIVPKDDTGRELGLLAIDTTMTEGGLVATDIRLMLLAGGQIEEGDYRLQFVKRLTEEQRQRRRSLPRLVVSNDRGGAQ